MYYKVHDEINYNVQLQFMSQTSAKTSQGRHV